MEPLAAAHLAACEALFCDPDVLRFTRVPEPPPEGFPRGWLASYEAGRREGSRDGFAGLDARGAFVGVALALTIDREALEVELGFIVAPAVRGRGVGTARFAD